MAAFSELLGTAPEPEETPDEEALLPGPAEFEKMKNNILNCFLQVRTQLRHQAQSKRLIHLNSLLAAADGYSGVRWAQDGRGHPPPLLRRPAVSDWCWVRRTPGEWPLAHPQSNPKTNEFGLSAQNRLESGMDSHPAGTTFGESPPAPGS